MENDIRKNQYPIVNNKKEVMNIEFKENEKKEMKKEFQSEKKSPKKNKTDIINPVDIIDKLSLIYENKEKNEKNGKTSKK